MTNWNKIVLALALPLAACGGDDEPIDTEVECPAVEDPTIQMVEITPTTAAAGDTLGVMVHGEGLGFGGSQDGGHGGGHEEGSHEQGDMSHCAGGHIHVYMDDLMTNPLVMSTEPSFDLTLPDDVTAGDHTIIVRLHNRDHTIYEPQVTHEVTVTVQ